MPETNLPQLLQNVAWNDKAISQSLYALVEALVEAVEPEKHTCGECARFHKECYLGLAHTPAPKCFVARVEPEEPAYIYAPMLNATLREVERLRKKLAEAKATLKREREEADIVFGIVREQRNEATDALEEWDTELAEAKAQIETLRQERDSAELKLETLKAIDGRILADAEIGRLVRGMRDGTRLDRGYRYYAPVDCGPPLVYASTLSTLDPAEALRAIQQEDDAAT